MVNDEQLLIGLLSCSTVRETAKTLGISEATIYSRLRCNDFQKKYTKAKMELLDQNLSFLQQKIHLAIQTLAEVCEDDTNPSQSRVNASSQILRNYCMLDEHLNFSKRLTALEEIIKENKK